MKGGERITVYESLSLMISFGMLVIAILSFNRKNKK
ncbi:putative holin-like toxin [Thermaerobacillus caldiproteolyticus]|nr:putative holin-like toxin [Anoxybacillus caldiproteolyticus]